MLDDAATKNNRTLTAETVDRLLSSFSLTSHPANLAFLMSRMEMRAAEAELDIVSLKMMMAELVMALWASIAVVSNFSAISSEEISLRISEWKDTIRDALEKDIGDFGENVSTWGTAVASKAQEWSATSEQKLTELQNATAKAAALLDQIKRQTEGK